MSIEVRPVRSRKELAAFVQLPFRLHAGDPIWTPPLRDDFERSLGDSNPLWNEGVGERQLFVAWDGETPVGRILAHVHHASNERHGEKAGFFGLLECPDDPAIAGALLDAAAAHHRARGLTILRGPYELTITGCIGAVVDGFDEPAAFSQSWNAPHIPKLLETQGFEVVYKAATWRLDDVQGSDPDALLGEKQRTWLADPRVHLRSWDLKRFDQDVRAATTLLHQSFGDNFGFVPMSEPEIAFMAAPMKRVVRPELTVFLEFDGQPVGVGMFLPDFHVLFRRMQGELFPFGWAQFLAGGKSLDAAVVQFIATSPHLQNKGLMRIVIAELLKRLQKEGFRTLDATWIGDVNAKSRASAEAIGMRRKHRLHLYAKAI